MGFVGDIANLGLNLWMGGKKTKYGNQQLKEAEKMKPADIKYEIPSAVKDAVNMYKGLSQQGLPGEDIIRDQMGAAYAGAASNINRTADSGVGALGAMSGLYGRFMNSVRDLGIQSSQVRAQNQQNYILQNAGAQMQLGDYQDKAWEYNTNIPFQRKMNEYWATKQAGQTNLWGGLDQMAAGTVKFAESQDKQMNQLLSMATGGMGGQQQLAGQYTPSTGSTMQQSPNVYQGQPQLNLGGSTNSSPNYSWGNFGNANYGINRPR